MLDVNATDRINTYTAELLSCKNSVDCAGQQQISQDVLSLIFYCQMTIGLSYYMYCPNFYLCFNLFILVLVYKVLRIW